MFIREVGKFLNMQCHISFRDGSELLKVSEDYSLDGICKLRVKGQSAYLITNLSKKSVPPEAAEKLKKIGFDETPNAFKITRDTLDPAFIKLFRELVKIPSVVIDAVFLHEGVRHLVFRFHDTDQETLSRLLLEKPGLEEFEIRHLGRNVGLNYLLKVECSLVALYYEISATIPPSSMDITGDSVITTFGNNWYREVKYLLNEDIQAVYYERSNILNKASPLKEISSTDKIYEMTFQNPLVSHIFARTTDDKISLLGMQHRMVGREFLMGMLVPEIVAPDFQQVLSDVYAKYKEWNIVLSSAATLREALS